MARPRWRRRGVLAIGFAGVAAAAAGSAAWIARRPEATAAAPAVPLNTAKITRQTLVDQRTVPGRLAYGAEFRVETPLEGIITWLPEVGSVVDRGKASVAHQRSAGAPVLRRAARLPRAERHAQRQRRRPVRAEPQGPGLLPVLRVGAAPMAGGPGAASHRRGRTRQGLLRARPGAHRRSRAGGGAAGQRRGAHVHGHRPDGHGRAQGPRTRADQEGGTGQCRPAQRQGGRWPGHGHSPGYATKASRVRPAASKSMCR